MSHLPEPTKVNRPTPVAEWQVGPATSEPRENVVVRRFLSREVDPPHLVRISGRDGALNTTVEVAAKLGAAICAAAAWTDEPVITCSPDCQPDCTCAPLTTHTIDGDVLHGVVLSACPHWMAGHVVVELADTILCQLARLNSVIVVRGPHGTPWIPDVAADTTSGGIR